MRPSRLVASALLSLLVIPTVNAQSVTCSAASGRETAALVELYTSEGCSSCPPADRWLSTLRASSPGRVVPLSLHVDYWDYIGWRDPYAKALFSQRQRDIAAIGRSRVVYTPQVVLAGKDFRGWSSKARFAEAVNAVNATAPRAHITLAVKPAGAGSAALQATAGVADAPNREGADLYVALFENGLSNRVNAGENRGATLTHDHVVREWWGPVAIDGTGSATLERSLAAAQYANRGVAAFVQNRRSGEILQALALPACRF